MFADVDGLELVGAVFDLMVDVVWIIALIVLIIVVDGPAFFA